jgi:hypothetical protein
MHRPACQRAALESPAFAHITFSFVTATTTAVAPAFSSSSLAGLPNSYDLYLSSYAIPGLNLSSNSTWMKVSVRASPILPYANVFLFDRISIKWFATNLDTSPPPWPSNTPNTATC